MKHGFADKNLTVVLMALLVLVVLPLLASAVRGASTPPPATVPVDIGTVDALESVPTTTTQRTVRLQTNVPRVTEVETQPTAASTATRTTATTETTATTTRSTVPDVKMSVPHAAPGRFTHIAVYLDLQIVVMYGNEGTADVAMYCSTGAKDTPTPTSPPGQPFRVKYPYNKKSNDNADFVKWDGSFVRYPTQVYGAGNGGIFFHSVPYPLWMSPKTLDKAKVSVTGYNYFGKVRASHGCIRMSWRDAKFLHLNSYKDMPIYIFASSKGHGPLPPPLALPQINKNYVDSNINAGWDPTDTDPRSPYNRGAIYYSVRYDANGAVGEVPLDSAGYEKGESAVLKAPGKLQKQDLEFKGWSLTREGDKTMPSGSLLQVNGNVILYAIWGPKTTQPTAPTPPAVPEEPEQPSDPTDPPMPSGPEQPSDPTDPPVPSEPEQPSDPTDPPVPSEPEQPSDPTDPPVPSEPEQSSDPTAAPVSTEPNQPSDPTPSSELSPESGEPADPAE